MDWAKFFAALTAARYDYVVSIEHEDRVFEGDENWSSVASIFRAMSSSRLSTNICEFSPSFSPSPTRWEGVTLSNAKVNMKKYIGCDLAEPTCVPRLLTCRPDSFASNERSHACTRGHEAVMQRMADLFLQVIQSAGMKKKISVGLA